MRVGYVARDSGLMLLLQRNTMIILQDCWRIVLKKVCQEMT